MKTYMARSEDIEKKWYVIDANGESVGRLASKIARILRGKQKPEFTPHADVGDFVVVVNADRVKFTGKKWSQKRYYWHTPYPGGLKTLTAEELFEKDPQEVLRKAVRGMLPKNKWQKRLIKRLKIYTGSDHPHEAQQPEALEI